MSEHECSRCNGSGQVREQEPSTCGECNGSRYVASYGNPYQGNSSGGPMGQMPCPRCHGSGEDGWQWKDVSCSACYGRGVVTTSDHAPRTRGTPRRVTRTAAPAVEPMSQEGRYFVAFLMLAAVSACYLHVSKGVALWPAFWKSAVYFGGAIILTFLTVVFLKTKMMKVVGLVLCIGLLFFLYQGWRWVYMGQPFLW